MDQSVSSQQLDKIVDKDVVADTDNVVTDLDMNNRFLNELNTDCHLEVLKYLSVPDLLQVSKLGPYFKEIIKKWTIRNKSLILELTGRYDKVEHLKAFGPGLRKIRIYGSDYGLILETIMKYCTPNIMTDIEIIVNSMPVYNSKMTMKPSLPLFTNLQKLRIDDEYGVAAAMVVDLKEIAVSALDLKVLKVRGENVQGEWLRTKYMKNLSELWIHTSREIQVDDLTYFIREHPQLQVFSFTGKEDFIAIGNCLSKNCKNLKKFYYEDSSPIHEADITYLVHSLKNGNKQTNRIDFLSSFSNLNVVTFNSSSYFNESLISLASRYKVKELNIYIELNGSQNRCKFKHSIDYQKVEIDIQRYSHDVLNREPCQSSFQYTFGIVRQMRNLEKITIGSRRKFCNLYKILEILPNIRTLSISNVEFLHLPVEIWKIVNVIRKNRQNIKHGYLVHLIVNEAQYRELGTFEKEHIMTVSIDPAVIKR